MLNYFPPQIMQLGETLQSISAEKEHHLLEATKENLVLMAELEQIRADLASVTQERYQLLELLQGLREEKIQQQKDLEEKEEMVRGVGGAFFLLYRSMFDAES